MFSKNSVVATLMAAVMTFIAGCDSKIGEAPPEAQAHEYAGASCLSNTSSVMREFVEGRAKEADINALWGCLGGAVQSFQRYVRGSDKSRYTSQELATFIEKNFLDQTKGAKISPELQLEFMKLKQLFLGGNVNYITQKELTGLQDVFALLKGITVRLNPYMKIVVLKWSVSDTNQVQKDMQFFEDANKELQNSAKLLATHIEKNGQAYNLSDVVTFLQELSKTLDDNWSGVELVRTYMPVVKKTKKALAGGNENSIAPNEWRRFSLLGARGYVQYLRYYYFIEQVPETDTGYRLTYLARTIEDVLSVFQDLVAEKPEGVVSRDEVNDLLLTFSKVWPDFKISPKMILETMKVKQLIFGGSVDSFTTNDFKTARMKVNRLKAIVERFLPYYPIYSRDWDPQMYSYQESQRLFQDAQAVLEQSGTELGALVEGPYDLKDVVVILREYEKLYPRKDKERSQSKDDKYVPISEQIEKLMPLIVDAKNMVFGGNDSTLSKKIWSPLLSLGSRVYMGALYHHYFVADKDREKAETLWSLSTFSNQSLNVLRDILVKKPVHQVSMSEIMLIINRLKEADYVDEKVNLGSLKTVLGLVVNNVLVDPEDRLGGYVPNAITMHSVELLREELQIWLDTEIFFSGLTRNFNKNQGLRPRDFADAIEKARTNVNSSAALRTGLKELGMSVATPAPLTIDQQGRLFISRELPQVYDQSSMSQLNLNRMVARILMRSFAGNLSRIKAYAGVTVEEVNKVFNTVKPFFVDLQMLEPENETFGDARFRDANIFMPHSDGNKTASFIELTDLVGMLWSGVTINTMLTESMPKDCLFEQVLRNPKTGVSKLEKMVKVDCAANAYRSLLEEKMTATPVFRRYLRSIDRDETLEFINNIFKSSGYVPNKSRTTKLADLGQVPHAIQYIEMIFTRFDENSDGVLTKYEALKAYDLFAGLLGQYAGDQVAPKDLDSVFMFLLRYGKAPTTLKEKATWFLRWKGKPDNWNVAADRSQLARILGYIADMSNQATAQLVPEIPESVLNQ
ncbi:hypothetical protein B9G69_011425 [Bdellovibrio sp. SKB1291214]|uniref:hypothetical protein n=1 Tax=Bdellovibrio sp. SKB1291214 TaxID=1732569 RepID=UPI00223F6617|nr:hypothetical protein [Bdellovibrio sp. SKB1291214]UYL07657.1 hypothetical protein B9G69_011425 [Bdellovibrio sp. SKB1291214]